MEGARSGYSVTFRLRHKDGSYRCILARAQLTKPVRGEPRRMLGCHVDITDLRSAQDELAKEKKLSDDIIASLPGVFYFYDEHGRFLRWNRAFERASGYGSEEIARMHPSDFFEGADKEHIVERIRDVFQKGEATAEAHFVSKDGRRTPHYFTGRRIEIEGAPYLAGLGIDISGMKQIEEELHALSARLLQTQDEERRRLARELHDSTAQKLAGAVMNLSLAGSQWDNPKEARELLGDTQTLIDAAAQEIRTLSYLLHPPLLDELGLLGAVRDCSQGFAKRSGIKVTLDLAEDLGRLPRAHETALFRILQESLTNVHRHSGSPTATVVLAHSTREVRLVVRDAGCGMASTDLPGPGRSGKPLGVGVVGMRERMRQLGGRLEVTSNRSGTTVAAILPINRSES